MRLVAGTVQDVSTDAIRSQDGYSRPQPSPVALSLGSLNEIEGVRHGFFTREGGVSTGIYASLNCGYGSRDDPAAVTWNRAAAMGWFEMGADRLCTVHQIHSAQVVMVQSAHDPRSAPQADAMVTDRPDVALGILTADCAPVLLAEPTAGVVGAAHAGWRGAFSGVLEATVVAMQALGAVPERIIAAIGPHIGAFSYEIGPEFFDRFHAESPTNDRFFIPAVRKAHHLFDLGAYVAFRLGRAGVTLVHRGPWDTLREGGRFFSHRRSVLSGEPDYGRNLSTIMLMA